MTGIRNFALREGSEGQQQPALGHSVASVPEEAVVEGSGSHGNNGTRKVCVDAHGQASASLFASLWPEII